MKIFVIAIATTGTLLLSRIASATELPSYEAMGFPITAHRPKLKSIRLALMGTSPSQLTRDPTASNYADKPKAEPGW